MQQLGNINRGDNLKTIHLIAAARPNFMKIAPLYHAFKEADWAVPIIVHTGQHYDLNMSESFFKDLMLPAPHHHLGVGSGSHAEQTGRVMIAYEKLLMEKGPDLVVVVGDVNSTVACTLAAVKLGVKTAHLEAGLRSFDRSMPEEINRIITDAIADILWTPSPDGDENLLREGIAPEKIQRVGNIMIDSLEMMRPRIMAENAAAKYGLENGAFGVVTLHRPANVDNPETLAKICDALRRIATDLPLIFPVHPRTRKNLEAFGLYGRLAAAPGMHLDGPVSYIPFMNLVFNCRLAITDSGGIQEETTYLGVPCLTLRPNTERPITVSEGTNRLCTAEDIESQAATAMAEKLTAKAPPLWDGKTAGRVVASARAAVTSC
ncbi:MAG: UDP-N-acetylglucosamine 2-epimerase (non-hydrolyzing) [Desulfobacteraceae bacterium]|nr:UDP-N-acetylglucosamine 2-epimerase (non-hydrolyzing) [Desulfobacteraceae bacterium]